MAQPGPLPLPPLGCWRTFDTGVDQSDCSAPLNKGGVEATEPPPLLVGLMTVVEVDDADEFDDRDVAELDRGRMVFLRCGIMPLNSSELIALRGCGPGPAQERPIW